jgi:hypothetical protein
MLVFQSLNFLLSNYTPSLVQGFCCISLPPHVGISAGSNRGKPCSVHGKGNIDKSAQSSSICQHFPFCVSKERFSQSRPMPDIWLASDPRVTSSHLTISKSEKHPSLREISRNSGTNSVTLLSSSSKPPCKRNA